MERSTDLPLERRIVVHLGDAGNESDGDSMGDGINVVARLEVIVAAGSNCRSEDACRQARDRLKGENSSISASIKDISRSVRVNSVSTDLEAVCRGAW